MYNVTGAFFEKLTKDDIGQTMFNINRYIAYSQSFGDVFKMIETVTLIGRI